MSQTATQSDLPREIIGGATVLMSPRPATNHNAICLNLARIFATYLRGKRCRVFLDGIDVHLDEENTFVPDLMIVCDRAKIRHDAIYGAPDLVVEVLSPSTAARDRGPKRAAYERAGVREYWIISPEERSIEVYLMTGGVFSLDNVYTVYPDWMWEKMTAAERAAAALTLKVSLYDDLCIDVREVFENLLP